MHAIYGGMGNGEERWEELGYRLLFGRFLSRRQNWEVRDGEDLMRVCPEDFGR